MKTIDILESKIKEALVMKTKLEEQQQQLKEEIEQLRGSVSQLEIEKEKTKQTIDMIIEKEYIHSLASFLEERLKENTSQVIDLNIPYPLLLAIFKIADDFFRTKTELEEFKKRAEDRSKQLVQILDDALENGDTFVPASDVEQPTRPSLSNQEELFK
jgi:CHAD domain-containing protein